MSRESHIAVGKSVRKIDAFGKVTGAAPYPGDIDMDGQHYMKIRFSDRPHARITRVDAGPALAMPGVVGVFTAADVPVNEYGLILHDQPVLCGPGSSKSGADIVRCTMDMIAVVVAETEALAAQAAAAIIVEYEDLPAVFEMFAAMEEGAPQLHDDKPGNVLCHFRIRKGDMDAGWAACAAVAEAEYSTGYQEHAYLQPEAGIGYIDEEGRITIVVAGQWTHEDQESIAHALDVPPEQVRVIYPAIGGAFGGREDMSIQIVMALAVQRLRIPIKTIWSREESIRFHHKRHPITVRIKMGASQDGKLQAVEARVWGDAGAYAYTSTKVMANANLMVTGAYEIPNCHIDTWGVLTNNIPTGAFRGFGAPQALFAAEGIINRLSQALNLDPVEFRLLNSIQEGSHLSVGTPLPPGVSMKEVIEQCAVSSYWAPLRSHWRREAITQPLNPALRRGIGFACGFKNVGYSFGFPEQSWATIELYGGSEIEEVVAKLGGADVGQGAHTAFIQMAAEAVGVPMAKVRLIASDTATSATAGSASASRLTFMAGNAIRGAAAEALEKWHNEERPAKSTYQYRPPATTAYDPQTGKAEPNFAYGYVAQAVEAEVDIETGQIRVLRVVCADDVGLAVNPQLVQGQIEGAVVQALGYAVMENLISREGKIINPYLSTYLIPTVFDVPIEVKSVILEYPDPIGPWGARGMAEMPFLPLAPALAAAIQDATGVWIDAIPLTPDRVVAALRAQGVGML